MLLKELSNLPGVSGNEDLVRDKIIELVTPLCDKLRVDKCGNVIAYIEGRQPDNQEIPSTKPIKVMINAHMDEVGFIITGIDKKGNLKFNSVGGVDDRILPGKRVLVGKKRVLGVIGCKPIHLQSEAEFSKTFKVDELRIDIGADSLKSAQKLVKAGDVAVFDTEASEFGEDKILGKALDDRAGCAILIEMLKQIKRPTYDLYVCFSTGEEIGLIGSKIIANQIKPDIGIAIEGTTCSDVPGVLKHETSSVMGDGPVLTIMDGASVSDRNLNILIVETAKALDIKFQFKNTVSGGNDAASIQKAASGAKVASISVPCRYIHSPLSVLNINDYNNCIKLVVGVLEKLSETRGNIYD